MAFFLHNAQLIVPEQFSAIPWLTAGCTTRHFGWEESPSRFYRAFQLLNVTPEVLIRGEQIHSNKVHIIEKSSCFNPEKRKHMVELPDIDGLITLNPDVGIAVVTADCAPIFLVETEKKIIGLVHAGWKGTLEGIALQAIEKMLEVGATIDKIHAWIGPTIGVCCYEVSEELTVRFADTFSYGRECMDARNLDLPQLNALQLHYSGLREQHIVIEDYCTKCHVNNCYSYRAEGEKAGRMISFMMKTTNE